MSTQFTSESYFLKALLRSNEDTHNFVVNNAISDYFNPESSSINFYGFVTTGYNSGVGVWFNDDPNNKIQLTVVYGNNKESTKRIIEVASYHGIDINHDVDDAHNYGDRQFDYVLVTRNGEKIDDTLVFRVRP